VVVVDDDVSFRQALRAFLEGDGRLDVVGIAGTGAEALALVVELKPDVVSMDLEMPVMNGIEATKAILHHFPETHVVVVSGPDFKGNRNAVLSVGAEVVIPKERVFEDFVDVVLGLVGGQAPRPGPNGR
jgi:two-component system, NarL family, response regulator DegU